MWCNWRKFFFLVHNNNTISFLNLWPHFLRLSKAAYSTLRDFVFLVFISTLFVFFSSSYTFGLLGSSFTLDGFSCSLSTVDGVLLQCFYNTWFLPLILTLNLAVTSFIFQYTLYCYLIHIPHRRVLRNIKIVCCSFGFSNGSSFLYSPLCLSSLFSSCCKVNILSEDLWGSACKERSQNILSSLFILILYLTMSTLFFLFSTH